MTVFIEQPAGVEINGMHYFQSRNVSHPKPFQLAGMFFETADEVQMATLLIAMRIRFMHHVRFPVGNRFVSPDFTLDRVYQWQDIDADPHRNQQFLAIEVKHSAYGVARDRHMYEGLFEARGIPTLLLSRQEIRKYLQAGALPLVERKVITQ